MMRRLTALAAALLLLSPSGPLAAEGGPRGAARNLAPNPSFEQAKAGRPEGWHVQAKAELGRVGAETLIARTGKRCVRMAFSDLVGPDQGAYLLLMGSVGRPPLKPNTVYTVSCYVRARNFSGRAMLGVYEYPTPFPRTARHRVELRGEARDWTRLSMSFKSRSDLKMFQVRLTGYCPSGRVRGELWFDDVSIVEGAPKEAKP